MLRLMQRLAALVPQLGPRMRLAAALKVGEALCMGAPSGVLLLVLHRLLERTLTGADILTATAVMAACFLAQGAFCLLFTRVAYPIGTELCRQVRVMVGAHLRTLPMSHFSRSRAGDTTALVSDDLVLLTLIPRMAFPQFVVALALPLALAPFLVAVDWRLALAALLPVPLALPVLGRCRKALVRGMRRRSEVMVAVSSAVIEYVQGMEVITGFGLAGGRFAALAALLERARRENLALVFRALPLMTGFQAILDAGFVALLLLGAHLLVGGATSLFAYLTFLVLALRMYEPVKALGTVYEITQAAEVTLDRLEALLALRPLPAGSAAPPRGREDIAFHDVSFAYDRRPVLRNVSFTIPANRVTVFVGPSGAGKTTILRLIARFWDTDSGEIRIGGTPVRELSGDALFDRLSMVFQDVYLFQGTIRENIAFGSPHATDEAVHAAARAARCHEFIQALPHGYATAVGEGGATLSQGEKQRISIARAILKDAPVILLDEATASVDPDNESQIQDAISALVSTKTVVMVAHRLATVTGADQIVVLDGKGGIAATGTHPRLLEDCEIYQRLWAARQQALGWKVGI
jgi:ATP-binding cassette subfamily B protein